MLQRIQSVWLFLASACAFASLKLPIYTGVDEMSRVIQLNAYDHFYIMLLTIAIGVIALVNIFLYGNRKLQFRFCMLGIVLEALTLFFYFKEINEFTEGTFALTSLLQAGILFFFFLAAKGIRRDEKIIRDSNRLR